MSGLDHPAALENGQFGAIFEGKRGGSHSAPSLSRRCNLPVWGWHITMQSSSSGPVTAEPEPVAIRPTGGTTFSQLRASTTSPDRAIGRSTVTPTGGIPKRSEEH